MISRRTSVAIICILAISFVLPICMNDVAGDDGDPLVAGQEVPDAQVGIYLLSISNFDSVNGIYDLDLYLYVYWNPLVMDEPNLQIINAITMKKDAISESISMGGTARWYLVRATLFTTADLKHYPFDSIPIKVVIEDDSQDISVMTLNWIEDECGIDDMFITSGWKQSSIEYDVGVHDYPWGKSYSQLEYTLTLERNSISSAVNILLPPIIFCFVSFLAFIISPIKDNPMPVRLSLGTGMIISAVLFHVAQSSALPPFTGIRQLDIIMMSAYAAIASTLVVTVLCHLYHTAGRPDEDVLRLNKIGFVISLAMPFITYAVLYILFV